MFKLGTDKDFEVRLSGIEVSYSCSNNVCDPGHKTVCCCTLGRGNLNVLKKNKRSS